MRTRIDRSRFAHAASGKRHVVPGFFAADGEAAETSAKSGDQWRVRFSPDRIGQWRYEASFRMGQDVALSLDPDAGTPAAFDGVGGCGSGTNLSGIGGSRERNQVQDARRVRRPMPLRQKPQP